MTSKLKLIKMYDENILNELGKDKLINIFIKEYNVKIIKSREITRRKIHLAWNRKKQRLEM